VKLKRPPTRRSILNRTDGPIVSPRTGATLEILAVPGRGADGELLIRRTLRPDMGRSGPHVHVDFAETFRIEQGIGDARIDGRAYRFSAGQTFYVPPGVPHVNPFNGEIEADLVLTQSFEPATEGVRSYVQTLAALLRDGRDENGDLPRWLVYAIGDATGERTYADGYPRGVRLPYGLQRALLPVGALVAGARGYTVHLPRDR
jgi:mannose-6-phosphate isomerase-like protein (cupin superfamily)